MSMRKRLFAWVGRNEKHLSTAAFVVSFIIDNLAYERVDVPWVTFIFTAMMLIAAISILVSHYLHRDRADAAPSIKNPFYTLLPIIAQFFMGGLLSGCLIFYTRSANLIASWPFILLLVVIFLGNEVFSKYRERLTFQCVQLFFGLYLYAIFELPIARGAMNSLIFVESGVVSVVVFGLFLGMLHVVGAKRLTASLRRILITSGILLLLVNFFYFAGVLPPLPLSLREADVYHSVARTPDGYEVSGETGTKPLFGPEVVHVVPGSPLYVYSAVFAPIRLSTPVVHRWEEYVHGSWQTVAKVGFPIAGGRDTGYRGYSELENITPGAWRVSIETQSGAVIGRVRFNIENVTAPPELYSEIK